VDTSANLPSIVADRGRLIQVLLNLGSNAIKYNVEGGWVLLTALPYDDVVRFIVRDTGKGIPAERQREIFEPFNRLGVELTQQEGSGIGLTISRRLVQAMDGKIGFESFVGQGSKFWVELPVANETAAKMARVPSLFATAADTRCKILYIEDKIPNVELMRAIIEDLSHTRFIDAQTVEEGLKIARSLRPDLVITDIHLPDGKGFDVLRGLRNDDRTSHIPVVALTADAMPSNMHNMELAGFHHVLTKPLKIPDLMEILRATLKAA
jgi:CheY-like chemotaxis protein